MKLFKFIFCSILGVSIHTFTYSQVKDTSVAVFTAKSVTAISPNLVYRIQIATVADKSKVAPLLKHYGITDEPFLETINATTIKVLIGSYPNYSSGEARVDELKHKGLKAAFVVPYYKGQRVTLQEAASHSQE